MLGSEKKVTVERELEEDLNKYLQKYRESDPHIIVARDFNLDLEGMKAEAEKGSSLFAFLLTLHKSNVRGGTSRRSGKDIDHIFST